jgi:hypothetical protein
MMAKEPKAKPAADETKGTTADTPNTGEPDAPTSHETANRESKRSALRGTNRTEDDDRELALEHAVHWGTTIAAGEGSSKSPEQIVAAAKQFADFLQGKDKPRS